jgi:acyl-coenzyme A thioesterase PaaI-like protein
MRKPTICGNGNSQVELVTTAQMAADEQGLVHGGFIFGAADYAAMIAVNHPHVVLGASDVKFLKPVRVGETVMASATGPGGQREKILGLGECDQRC